MRRKTAFVVAGLFALTALIISCGVQVRATGADAATGKAGTRAAVRGESQVVFRFFDEDFISGGFDYAYPEASRVMITEDPANVKNGEAALQFDLVADDFSGGAVCLWNMTYDLTPHLATGGALQFWIKGARGGEIATVALADDENNNGKKTVVRLPINNYGGITTEWTQISVPLRDFGRRGVYWDAKNKVEVPEPFQWDQVAEFRIEIARGNNPSFRVWVDDIFIVSNVYESGEMEVIAHWDEKEEVLPNFPRGVKPDGLREMSGGRVLNGGINVTGGFNYVYGGRTAHQVQKTEDGTTVLAAYMDASQYSGVSISIGEGKYVDLTAARSAPSAGLAFWGRGCKNAIRSIIIGLLDNQGKTAQNVEVKVQTTQIVGDYGPVSTDWKFYMIPIRAFMPQGKYWDDSRGAEVFSNVDWSKIQEVRFSVSRDEYLGRVPDGEPVTFYVSEMMFIDEIPGYVNPEDYWNAFRSDTPEVLLHDFATPLDRNWHVAHCDKSEASFKIVESGNPDVGRYAIEITYRLRSWADILYNYAENNRPAEHRDWSNHWGLKFDFWTDRPYQPIVVQVGDKGNELFTAPSGGNRGWSEIIVPFREFTKFPHYQPPDAIQTGTFDLDGVQVLDFKPAGEGSRGTFRIANVRLTNDRVARVEEPPANVTVKIEGSLEVSNIITERINPGIFGINVAMWNPDFRRDETKQRLRAVNHHVLRYPGGLRADDDDWEEVLAANKPGEVATNEYFDILRETGTEGMITVNFGSGTPEKAAKWVAHAKARNAPVRLWEIGNELYGAWHSFHTTAEDYGRRAREFAVQMRRADPNAVITAVWALEADWNKVVFEHMKDVVDGVNIHHYPQQAGQQNDKGLLASPQTLDYVIPSVRRQLEDYGVPGKKYEIWLTEWNSVDFLPGPQTMSVVNALFVADYLGMLTRHNIEQASFWASQNSLEVTGGDYGYLSRFGAPDGDAVPRTSYWGFIMASHSLGRGSLFETRTGDDNITSYLTRDGNVTSIMLINKYPRTVANVELGIPGFTGTAEMQQLTPENSGSPGVRGAGPTKTSVNVTPGMKLNLPAYSITTITIGR
ncbi:MAG: hypothetical protein LBC70_08895 [Chitinispirillales bacterium]|jgi:hypothetical protein|nr:hypothetical protein [Chitinispirillales bacterium]